jgi:hypothetical protein
VWTALRSSPRAHVRIFLYGGVARKQFTSAVKH